MVLEGCSDSMILSLDETMQIGTDDSNNAGIDFIL